MEETKTGSEEKQPPQPLAKSEEQRYSINLWEKILLAVIYLLALFIALSLAVYGFLSFLGSKCVDDRIGYVERFLNLLQQNWIILTVMVFPLLYRPIHRFLWNLKEWGPMKTGDPKKGEKTP